MAVYLILNIEVTDADTYGDYVKQAPATVEQYGGRYLVRGGAAMIMVESRKPEV